MAETKTVNTQPNLQRAKSDQSKNFSNNRSTFVFNPNASVFTPSNAYKIPQPQPQPQMNSHFQSQQQATHFQPHHVFQDYIQFQPPHPNTQYHLKPNHQYHQPYQSQYQQQQLYQSHFQQPQFQSPYQPQYQQYQHQQYQQTQQNFSPPKTEKPEVNSAVIFKTAKTKKLKKSKSQIATPTKEITQPVETVDEIRQKILNNVDNQICADCDANQPKWASVNLGVLLCIHCSGVHRSLGTHISFIKSMDMDSWDLKALNGLKTNKLVNAELEYYVPDDFPKPISNSDRKTREKYITAKYKDKFFSKEKNCKRQSKPPLYQILDNSPPVKRAESISQVGQIVTQGILLITLIEGKDLMQSDMFGEADPYVVFSNGRQTVKSITLKNTVNPKWNNQQLSLCMQNLDTPLQIKVLDVDTFSEELMGTAEINLSRLNLSDKPVDIWVPLSTQGKIHLLLSYQNLN